MKGKSNGWEQIVSGVLEMRGYTRLSVKRYKEKFDFSRLDVYTMCSH